MSPVPVSPFHTSHTMSVRMPAAYARFLQCIYNNRSEGLPKLIGSDVIANPIIIFTASAGDSTEKSQTMNLQRFLISSACCIFF